MRSVAVGGYLSAFAHGIPSVNIVHIPVAVVIHTRHTVQFRLVHPHVGRQVGMVPLHAAVHDSHNHGRVSRRGLPRLEQVDIGTLYGTSDGTFVVVMPLLRQPRVVERLVRRPCRTDCRRSVHHLPRNTAPIVQRHYPIDGLDMRYAGKRRDAVLGTRHGHILIETDVVPQMKPIPAAAFGKPAAVAETAPYFGGTERSGGTGAKPGDSRGIEQRQRLTRRVVAQQRGAKDLGQPLFGILREPSSELETEEAASRQLARADIHIGHTGFELLIYHRPRNTLARCLLAIRILHGSNCILDRQHLGNFLGRKHHHLPHHRSSQRKLYVASLYGLVTMPPRIISCWNLQRFSL